MTTLRRLRKRQLAEEKKLVRETLTAHGWSLRRAAGALGVQPSSLRRTVEKLGLSTVYRKHNAGPGRPRGGES